MPRPFLSAAANCAIRPPVLSRNGHGVANDYDEALFERRRLISRIAPPLATAPRPSTVRSAAVPPVNGIDVEVPAELTGFVATVACT